MSVRRAIFLLLSMVLWLGALTSAPVGAAVEMRWTEATISRAVLAHAMEQAEVPVRAAIWDTQRVEGKTVAVYWGDPLLLSGDLMLNGSATECAVSRAVAIGTWGSDEVIGLTLSVNGKTYVVGGVYPSGVADVLIAWDGVSQTAFKQMAVQFPGQPDGAQYRKALDFVSAIGMAAPDELLDGSLLCDVARMAAFLPGWVLILLVAAWHWRAYRKARVLHVPARVVVVILAMVGMVLAMDVSLAPPKWLLPSRWSDFAHWGHCLVRWAVGCPVFLLQRTTRSTVSICTHTCAPSFRVL